MHALAVCASASTIASASCVMHKINATLQVCAIMLQAPVQIPPQPTAPRATTETLTQLKTYAQPAAAVASITVSV
jgi:hypothetical protein